MASTETMKAWAIEIKSEEDIPDLFRMAYTQLNQETESLPYSVYLPHNEKTNKPDSDQMVILQDDRIVILKKEETVLRHEYPFDSIQMIQIGTVLLQSWIRIFCEAEGKPKDVVLYFDTVVETLFDPFIQSARKNMLNWQTAQTVTSVTDELDYLKESSLKFLNYGRASLLPGQQVRSSVFQPHTKDANEAVPEGSTTPHLMILTDEELILIQETKQKKRSATQKYSGIWSHIPIGRITEVSLEAGAITGWERMKVHFDGQLSLDVEFDKNNRERIAQLAEKLKLMI
jgi:hypothetical protein